MTIEFTDPRDILLLSAALQVYHEISLSLATDAITEHEEIFSDEVVAELEKRIVDMANRVNGEARVLFAGIRHPLEMREDWRPYAVWGAHSVAGAKRFRDMVMEFLGLLVARNN